MIALVQERFGGRLWFNTLIPMQSGALMKYGVVSRADFLRDLLEWETFYLAGRLQKPVLELGYESTALEREVRDAMRLNRLRAYQLCKQEEPKQTTHTEEEEETALLERIVQLSYAGDVRVGLAESPSKIRDIVQGSRAELAHIYREFDYTAGADGTVMLPRDLRGLSLGEIHSTLERRVRRSSAEQTIKGLLTAGLIKSARYSKDKLAKRWKIR